MSTVDAGSRHAPDVQAAMTAADAAVAAVHTDEQRRDMEWLCSLIGCAAPPSMAPVGLGAATAPPASLPLPPLLRVSLLDGRVYTGRLHCTDSRANLVLAHASQEAGVIDGAPVGGFQIGQILVAWKLVAKVERMATTSAGLSEGA